MRRSLVAGALLLGVLSAAGSAAASGPMSRYYADDTQGVFWFVHISDLHIDTFPPEPQARLNFALFDVVEVTHPVAVFASGDLVDGTIAGIPTTGQEQAEWDLYKSILAQSGLSSSFFFDMPGNHDAYGDHGLTHYVENSVQGQATGGKLFVDTTHTTALGEYYFVGMNSAGTYAQPLSFGEPAFTNVDALEVGLNAHHAAQLVFVFAHHPLTQHGATDANMVTGTYGPDNPPSNAGEVISLLESKGAFYLHGHVHQYKESLQGNIVTVQLSNLSGTPAVDRSSVEGWDQTKHQSNIGIGIVDHNAFVYRVTDTTNPWPFVAITAPVDVNLQGGGTPAGVDDGVAYEGDYQDYGAQKNPYAYDVCLDSTTNPVRALVLSKDPVGSVSVSLDGTTVGPMNPAADPQGIYTGTVDTSGLEPGLHTLTVTAALGPSTRSDTIQVNFVDGPCAPLGDAGADAPAEDAGEEASVPEAGEHDSASQADAGAPDADNPDDDAGEVSVPAAKDESDSGCGCSAPGKAPVGSGSIALLLALALHRRRREGPH